MVKGTCILNEREITLQLITATQVANSNTFYNVLDENPYLAKLMMDNLKSFLTNNYFAPIERQTVLISFLESHTKESVIKDVLECVKNCELKEDYSGIILEWTYHNSQNIMSAYLRKYDAAQFCDNKKQNEFTLVPKTKLSTEEFIATILQMAKEDLQMGSDKDDGDEGDASV